MPAIKHAVYIHFIDASTYKVQGNMCSRLWLHTWFECKSCYPTSVHHFSGHVIKTIIHHQLFLLTIYTPITTAGDLIKYYGPRCNWLHFLLSGSAMQVYKNLIHFRLLYFHQWCRWLHKTVNNSAYIFWVLLENVLYKSQFIIIILLWWNWLPYWLSG